MTKRVALSVPHFALVRLIPLQFFNSLHDCFPEPHTVRVSLLEEAIGPLGGFDSGILAMLLDQGGSSAEYVEVGYHENRLRHPCEAGHVDLTLGFCC